MLSGAHLPAVKQIVGKTAMSVIPVDEVPYAVNGAAKRDGFWQRFAERLDAYFADRSRRTVPVIALRRSKHDVDRCRRLMHRGSAMVAAASVGGRQLTRTCAR
jgi:hypothetical protein